MSVRLNKTLVFWCCGITVLVASSVLGIVLWQRHYLPASENNDFQKVKLNKIFNRLDTIYWKDQAKTLSLVNEAMLISEHISDSNAIANALYNKARVYWKFGQYDSVLIICKQALAVAEKIKNDTLTARIKNIAGNYYLDRNNYYMALLYYAEVIRLAEKLQNEKLKGICSNGLGILYVALNDYDKAIKYFQSTNTISKKSGNVSMEAVALINIGNCYIQKKEFVNAIAYQKRALIKARQSDNTEIICKILINLGLINEELGNKSAALSYFYQALTYLNHYNNPRVHGIVLQQIGIFYAENNEWIQSENYLDQSLKIFSDAGFKSAERNVILALSDLKKRQGEWQEAYDYSARYIALSDSNLNSETKKKITDYQWEMESQKKKYERELSFKKSEIEKKRNLIFAISIISSFLIVLLFSRNLMKTIKFQKLRNSDLQENIHITEKINVLEKYRLQAEIEAKNKELTLLSLQVVTKNELLTDISETTSKLYKANLMNEISYNNLKKIIKENLNVEKDWGQFKSMFEKVNQDFFIKIKQIGPELSENELRLCAYLRINLANHEIARILNVSPGTIKTNRYRIRKKLNLENKTTLEDYIRCI